VNGFIEHLYEYAVLGTTLYSSLTLTDQCPQSIIVSTSRLLATAFITVEILHLPAFRSSCHSRPSRTLVKRELNSLGPRPAAISHRPPSLLFTG
jgi:hypothetical protein